MITHGMILFTAAGLLACGSGQKGSAQPSGDQNPCAGNPCANPCGGGGAPMGGGDAANGGDFSGWKGWTKVNAKPFLSKGHGKKRVDVYVPAEFADAYRAHAGTAPVGMRMVKVAYKDAAATSIDKLTVMTKMSAGYDADHGDWWYGVYDESGTKAAMSGKIEMCVTCHEDAEHDYVFGLPGK